MEAPPRAVRRSTVDHQAVARILGQLGKIGSNINQLARYAHMGRYQENSIELALRDLAELRHACLHALGQEPEPSPNGSPSKMRKQFEKASRAECP